MPGDWIAMLSAGSHMWKEKYNNDILQKYSGAVANYNASADIGHQPGTPPPEVPQFYKLVDGAFVGLPGVMVPQLTTASDAGITDLPQVHQVAKTSDQISTPGKIHVGPKNVGDPSGSYFSIMPDDGFPMGQITPSDTRSDDGTVGRFMKVGSAVGGWYLLLR